MSRRVLTTIERKDRYLSANGAALRIGIARKLKQTLRRTSLLRSDELWHMKQELQRVQASTG